MEKTSIIVVAYDTTRIQRKITSVCLAEIQKHTNRDEYELILIDQGNLAGNKPNTNITSLDNRHHIIDIDKYILIEHIGMSAAMNFGYKNSNPDYPYIVFMHNDVLVPDDWLLMLREWIEKGKKAVMPHQGPTPREYVIKARTEEIHGNDDAGLTMMTKEAFKTTGGWDERFKAIYMEQAFQWRLPEHAFVVGKCMITHIGCGTVYADETREKNGYAEESPLINDLRNNKTGLKINYL